MSFGRAVLSLPQFQPTFNPQSTHNPPTSKPDLAPEATPSSLLGAFALAFFLPHFQPAKSQGENTKHQPTARKVGFAFTPAPIRLVRGCWGCEYKWWCDWHRFIPWQRFFPPTVPPFKAFVLVTSLCGSLTAAALAAASLCWVPAAAGYRCADGIVVAFFAAAPWLRFAAVAAIRRQHISSWLPRFCLGVFIGCSVRRGFSLHRGSRSHAACSEVLGGVCAPPPAGLLDAPPSVWQLIRICKVEFTKV